MIRHVVIFLIFSALGALVALLLRSVLHRPYGEPAAEPVAPMHEHAAPIHEHAP